MIGSIMKRASNPDNLRKYAHTMPCARGLGQR
jgi:hypothetical protein